MLNPKVCGEFYQKSQVEKDLICDGREKDTPAVIGTFTWITTDVTCIQCITVYIRFYILRPFHFDIYRDHWVSIINIILIFILQMIKERHRESLPNFSTQSKGTAKPGLRFGTFVFVSLNLQKVLWWIMCGNTSHVKLNMKGC